MSRDDHRTAAAGAEVPLSAGESRSRLLPRGIAPTQTRPEDAVEELVLDAETEAVRSMLPISLRASGTNTAKIVSRYSDVPAPASFLRRYVRESTTEGWVGVDNELSETLIETALARVQWTELAESLIASLERRSDMARSTAQPRSMVGQ
jgi:hypothetical protein